MVLALVTSPLLGLWGMAVILGVLLQSLMGATQGSNSGALGLLVVCMPLACAALASSWLASAVQVQMQAIARFSAVAALAWAYSSNEFITALNVSMTNSEAVARDQFLAVFSWVGMAISIVAATCAVAFLLVGLVEFIFAWWTENKFTKSNFLKTVKTLALIWLFSRSLGPASQVLFYIFDQLPRFG